jgi:1-acyl-sn-glycerol-3-phosphate acyltransferase
MKTVRAIIFFPLALARLFLIVFFTFSLMLIGLRKLKKNGFSRELQIWAMHTWGTWILWAMGVKVEIKRQPEPANQIIMPNHRSYIDVPLIVKYNQGTLIGKVEVEKWPMAKAAIRITNPIMVDRSDLQSKVETMKKIKESIGNQVPVILFPEGTTYQGPLTKPFTNGSFKIAADVGIPVIPVAIHYIDPKDAWIGNDTFIGHFLRQMGKPQTKVIVHYGTPVVSSDYQTLKEQTKQQIEEMLKEIIMEQQKKAKSHAASRERNL